jgi:dolichol kinase/phosphoserine phosphatase
VTISSNTKRKLVIFDVEGVLIPKNRLFFEVGRSLGIKKLLAVLFYGFLYEIGVVQLKWALKHIFQATKGASMQLFLNSLAKLPLMPNVNEVFTSLKAAGYKIALISSGIPTLLVNSLGKIVGADYSVGVEVEIKNEVLTGEIWGNVIEPNGKLMVLKQTLIAEGLNLNDCIVVADDRNNASLFLKGVQKIGYNPDFLIRTKADIVVNGSLSNILPLIHGEKKRKATLSKNDILRETIHASGFFVPIVTAIIGIPLAVALISIIIAIYMISEWARLRGRNVPVISVITRHAASQSELCEFAIAPIYFALGILLTLLLFHAPVSNAAIAIFALGDSMASLIGGMLSKNPLPFNRTKTLEGSLSGFIFAFLAGSVFISPLMALVGATVAMIVEYLPLPINDNLLIPLCTGLVLTLLLFV